MIHNMINNLEKITAPSDGKQSIKSATKVKPSEFDHVLLNNMSSLSEDNILIRQERLQDIRLDIQGSKLEPGKKQEALALVDRLLDQLSTLYEEFQSIKDKQLATMKNMIFKQLMSNMKLPSLNPAFADIFESDDIESDLSISLLGSDDPEEEASDGFGLFGQFQQAKQTSPQLFDFSPSKLFEQVSAEQNASMLNPADIQALATDTQKGFEDLLKVYDSLYPAT
eukprot:COSAG01_NODE_165_length_23303_cov_269.524953_8_plen_225_part_00